MPAITLTLPDGSSRTAERGSSGADLAAAISKTLGKKAVAVKVDGILRDLDAELPDGSAVEILTRDDDESLELIRHDLAHVMAQAVTEMFPEAKPTIGPVIDGGFYYDFHCPEPFSDGDLRKIEKRMRQIVDEDIPLKREVWTRGEAKAHYEKRGEPLKAELVDAIPEGEEVSFYRQGGFLDLCRGPHMPSTRRAGKAFRLTSVAGSYWRGDSSRERLQRIYGTAWRSDEELKEHLRRIEEAERRDHRRLGQAMGLFHLQDETAGSVFWHPNGWSVYRSLQEYVRAMQEGAGYREVNTPMLVGRRLWERSGHWQKFREHMYLVENEEGILSYAEKSEEGQVFGLKPMNCPGHVMVFNQGSKSYRDLPLRIAEFGSCHRCEPRGALHGIMRVRAFTQDDAHVFCAAEQIVSETAAFVSLLDRVYRDLGFSDYKVKYADRPPVRSGDDAEHWDKAERALLDACEQAGIEHEHNPGEGAFYGPKLEIVLTDALGREWQCGTLQVDFVLPGSLGAEYTDADGSRKTPVMLHRAILGSFERFIGILVEHTDGHLPLWMSCPQAVVANITSPSAEYAKKAAAALKAAGLRARADVRNEKINYKVREHSAAKVPVICVVGDRELDDSTLTLRRLGSRESETMPFGEAVETLAREAIPPHLQDGDLPSKSS